MLENIFESDYTAQYKGRAMEEWKQEVADRAPRINDRRGRMLTYVLPFKADEIYYAETYGVRARDVVDLYSTYHRHMDYKHTAQALLQVMTESDPEVGLDKTLPDSFMSRAQGKPKRQWAGRTLGEVLRMHVSRKGAKRSTKPLEFDGITEEQAFVLISGGKPARKPAEGSRADIQAQARAVRPNGLLVELYQAWTSSAAAAKAKFNDVDALQIFNYHRVERRGRSQDVDAIRMSVSPAPSRFREGVEKMGLGRRAMKDMGVLFGARGGRSAFSPEFWAMSIPEQLATMKSGKSPTNPNNWIKVLESAFEMDVEKSASKGGLGIKKGTANSYKGPARERIWRAVSAKMKQLMDFTGATFADAGDYLAQHAAGLSPSPTPVETGLPGLPGAGPKKRAAGLLGAGPARKKRRRRPPRMPPAVPTSL